MASLLLETYDVCLGTGPSDPAKAVWTTGMLTAQSAERMRQRFDELRAEGAFAPSLFAGGQTFFVEGTPGQQVRASVATTQAELVAELNADPSGSVVLFAKQVSPQAFIRVASAPVAQVLKMAR